MAAESATATYYMAEPVDDAVRLLRGALDAGGLTISGELDMAVRLQRRLHVETPACKVLFVSLPASRCRDTRAALAPLHVVVAQRNQHSEVHIVRVPPGEGELAQLRTQIAHAIERIAMRALLCV